MGPGSWAMLTGQFLLELQQSDLLSSWPHLRAYGKVVSHRKGLSHILGLWVSDPVLRAERKKTDLFCDEQAHSFLILSRICLLKLIQAGLRALGRDYIPVQLWFLKRAHLIVLIKSYILIYLVCYNLLLDSDEQHNYLIFFYIGKWLPQ